MLHTQLYYIVHAELTIDIMIAKLSAVSTSSTGDRGVMSHSAQSLGLALISLRRACCMLS